MLDRADARALAHSFLRQSLADECPDVTIVETASTEHEGAFLFGYDSARSLAGDPDHALAGNHPVLVDRRSGEVRYSRPADIIRLRPDQAAEFGYMEIPAHLV